MTSTQRTPIKFDRPPVTEVVCGVSFTLTKPIKTAHIGRYWSRVADEFPRCDDAPPIAQIIEGAGPADSTEFNIQFEQIDLPPLRRAWLINEPGTHLLQLQEEKFLFNWKRVGNDANYPSFPNVISDFKLQWEKYRSFLVEQKLGEPSIVQLELTYWNFLIGQGALLKDFQSNDANRSFLPKADAVQIRNIYSLPDGKGRLHVAASTARNLSTSEKGIRLELTARGVPKEITEKNCEDWFSLAHDWITQGFADITTDAAHRIWERRA